MGFDNVMVSSQDDILSGWQSYFKDLYAFTESDRYDDTFKNAVDKEVNEIL